MSDKALRDAAWNDVRKFDVQWEDIEYEFEIPCCNKGCRKIVTIEDEIHQGTVKLNGEQPYDSGRLIAVLSCRCQGPVCDECACEDLPDECRICGCEDFLAVELVSKRDIMDDRNYYKQWGSSNMQFFVMMHKDSQDFRDFNLGSNYPFFLRWFLANGGVVDIIKMNNTEMCVQVVQFRWFCLKINFLKISAAVMRRIAPSVRVYNSQFDIFMRESARIIGSLQPIIFRKKELKKYHLFGFLMKMIEKLAQPSVVSLGRQRLPHFFGSFHSRIIQVLLKL